MTVFHAALGGRFDVLDWGEEWLVYDRQEFLTHLLDAESSAGLRALLAEPEGAQGAGEALAAWLGVGAPTVQTP